MLVETRRFNPGRLFTVLQNIEVTVDATPERTCDVPLLIFPITEIEDWITKGYIKWVTVDVLDDITEL